MRKLRLIGVLFVVTVLTSCSPYPRESERMEAALQRADSVYGEGENDTVLFIPGLAEASSYFAEKKQYKKAALAALYNGYAEKDYDKDEAMSSFKEAEHYGAMTCDSLIMARAQYQLGRMLFEDYLHESALDLFRNAVNELGRQFDEKALAMNMMACCFMFLKEYDSAAFYIEQSLHYADLGKSNLARRKALNNYAVLYRLRGEYDKAIEYFRLVELENDEQLLLNCLNLGDIFMAAGNLDSARQYYLRVDTLLPKANIKESTKVAAYKAFSNYAECKGDLKTAIDYRKEYENLIFNILNSINQRNADRIQQKYDYESLQNALNIKIANRQRIIVLLSVLVSLILTVWGGAMLRLSRIQKNEIDLKTSLLHFTEQNLALRTKEQRVMQKLAVYLDNPSDKSLLLALKKTAWGDEGFWAEAFRLFDELHPKLRERLLLQYPNLSDQEQKILVLSGLNASREDTALLLQTSVHMVDKLRNSVKKKVSSLPV